MAFKLIISLLLVCIFIDIILLKRSLMSHRKDTEYGLRLICKTVMELHQLVFDDDSEEIQKSEESDMSYKEYELDLDGYKHKVVLLRRYYADNGALAVVCQFVGEDKTEAITLNMTNSIFDRALRENCAFLRIHEYPWIDKFLSDNGIAKNSLISKKDDNSDLIYPLYEFDLSKLSE